MFSNQTVLDRTAILISALCIIHCAIVPLIMLGLPMISLGPLQEEGFHLLLVSIVLPISVLGIILGCRQHKNYNIGYLGGFGLLVLLLSGTFGHDIVGEFGEKLLTVIGSTILIGIHIKNFQQCKVACCSV